MSNLKQLIRPRRATAAELKRAGVEIVNPHNFMLGCVECGFQ
jgi:hypothetical protein